MRFLKFMLFCLALSLPAYAGTPTHVNNAQTGTAASCGGSGSCIATITYTGYTAPDWITVICSGNGNTGTNTVTSSSGTVTNRTTFNDTVANFLHTYATITGASTGTVTITCTGTNMFRESAVANEYTNISAFDVASTTTWATTNPGTSVTSTAITTSTSGDMCESVAIDEGGQGGTPTPASPFTAGGGPGSTAFPTVTAYYVQPSSGSISLLWSGFASSSLSKPTAAMMCLTPTASSVVPRRR